MFASLRGAVFSSGVGSLCLSVLCLTAGSVPAMHAVVAPAVHAVVATVQAAVAVPPAQPERPKRRRRKLFGEGAIVVSGRGGVDVGTRRTSQNAVTQAGTQYGGSMTLDIERRTEQTTLALSQGVGYNAGSGSLSQLQVGYRTPGYSADYGLLTGSQPTLLSIGGFARGVRISKPRADGAVELLAAASVGNGGQGFSAYGARFVRQTAHTETDVTALRATGQHSTSTNAIAAIDYRRYRQGGTTVAEAALSVPSGFADLADGPHVAFALSHQLTGRWGYGELRLLDIPSGFAGLSGSQEPSQDLSVTARREIGRASVGITGDRLRIVASGTPQISRRVSLDLAQGYGQGNVALTGSIAADDLGSSRNVTRSAGLALSQTLGRFASLSETVQTAVSSGDDGGSRSTGLTFGASRQFGGGFVQLSLGANTGADAESESRSNDALLTVTRPVGRRLDLTSSVGKTFTRVGSLASTIDSLSLGVIGRISPTLSLRVAGTRNATHGSGASSGTSLQIDLVGPIAFGGANRYSGRGDPRLPATIRGHVFVASGGDITAAAVQQRGYGNVVVVLDNIQTQRTDAAGEFDFAFVKAGVHTVALEPASLPPGFIPDRRSETVRVEGGRIVGVDFAVGRFAGVGGRVYANGPAGTLGLGGATIVVDGRQRTTSGPDGRWSIGRLTPGTHRVALAPDQLPTSVAFPGALEKTVQVVDGAVTPVDFVAVRLGSAGGHVVSVDPNDASVVKGMANVYVVAQPGDHAAITDADGSFLLDNLPPGDYTIDVDKETVPEGMGGARNPIAQKLEPGQQIDGLVLTLGEEEKNVVFTFSGGKKTAMTLAFLPGRVPPGALVRAVVHGDGIKGPVGIESDLFRGRLPLKPDGAGSWSTAFVVPEHGRGDVPVEAIAAGATTASPLTVDPGLPLLVVRTVPMHPLPGKPVHLTVRSLAPLREGDVLRFDDGQTVRLPKPHGHTFELDVRLGRHGVPYAGVVTGAAGPVPLVVR